MGFRPPRPPAKTLPLDPINKDTQNNLLLDEIVLRREYVFYVV